MLVMSITLATLNFDLSRIIRAQTMCFEFRVCFILVEETKIRLFIFCDWMKNDYREVRR